MKTVVGFTSFLLIFAVALVLPRLLLEDYSEDDLLFQDILKPKDGKMITLHNNETVHYYIEGPKDAELVLVTHGISVSGRVMLPLSKPIAQSGFRTITFDFYGRGHSSSPDGLYNEVLFMNQTHDFLEALYKQKIISSDQYTKFHLIGFSMGGAVSVTFSATYPERIRSLTLIAPAGLPFKVPFVAHIATLPVIGELIQSSHIGRVLLNNRIPAAFEKPELFPSDIRELEMIAYFHMSKVGFAKAFLSTLLHFPLNNCTKSYEEVGKQKFPVLLMWGAKDKTVPVTCAKHGTDLIPRAELVILPNSGHMGFVEEKDIVIPKVTSFLKANN